MNQKNLNALILSGGFPGLLLDINSVQKRYRDKLDAAIRPLHCGMEGTGICHCRKTDQGH